MFDIEAEISINRSIEDVFNFVADSENDPQWAVPVIECIQVVGDAPGLGAQYTFASKLAVGKARGKMETVVFKPPQRIEWELESSINSSRARFTLKSEDGATMIAARTTIQARGIFRLMESMMEKEINKAYQQQFKNLKQLLESQQSLAAHHSANYES